MSVVKETSQDDISRLQLSAPLNMPLVSSTREGKGFHREKYWLQVVASWNIIFMSLTRRTFQFDKFWLKVSASFNIPRMPSTRGVFQLNKETVKRCGSIKHLSHTCYLANILFWLAFRKKLNLYLQFQNILCLKHPNHQWEIDIVYLDNLEQLQPNLMYLQIYLGITL